MIWCGMATGGCLFVCVFDGGVDPEREGRMLYNSGETRCHTLPRKSPSCPKSQAGFQSERNWEMRSYIDYIRILSLSSRFLDPVMSARRGW